jgi:hypothetical protein
VKIKGHITAVEDIGGQIKVTMQGSPVVDSLNDMQAITFKVPGFTRNFTAFHVGRKLTVEIALE